MPAGYYPAQPRPAVETVGDPWNFIFNRRQMAGRLKGSGKRNTPSDEIITARSITFCSSRMLPGQSYSENSRITCAGTSLMFLPRRSPICARKMAHQQRNVLVSLAEGGNSNGVDVEPIKEVLPEPA